MFSGEWYRAMTTFVDCTCACLSNSVFWQHSTLVSLGSDYLGETENLFIVAVIIITCLPEQNSWVTQVDLDLLKQLRKLVLQDLFCVCYCLPGFKMDPKFFHARAMYTFTVCAQRELAVTP
jgi:hypothetical protein